MKRPTWATVIGVLLIIFGALGLLGSIQVMFMPQIFELQQEMMGLAQDQGHMSRDDKQIMELMEDMFNMPPWIATWAVLFGLLGMAITALYLYSGIAVLQLKQNAIRMAYLALALSLMHAGIQVVTAMFIDSMMSIFFAMGATISIVIDLIIISVIASNDKTAYSQPPPPIQQNL